MLRLSAPIQAWGVDSKFDIRQTEREPSKSGVIGLLAAALGLGRDDDAALKDLNTLNFGVRIDQEGKLLRDFHMVHKDEKTSYLTHRYYLSDAVFLVGLESTSESHLQTLENAVRSPAFPLFLGRRSCPPSLPIVLGIRSVGLQQALYEEPWQSSDWMQQQYIRQYGKTRPHLRLITDAKPGDVTIARQKDVPLSFNPANRQYGYRAVIEHDFVLPPCPSIQFNITAHDLMQELR